MIDLGLAKLALIGVVALIVIGPERLPKVARMAGSLIGRAQRYLNSVKAEVSREMELDELRRMQHEVEQAASSIKSSVNHEVQQVEQLASINSIWPGEHATTAETNQRVVDESSIAKKAREFHRKRVIRTAALPLWYKQRQGYKLKLLSASARVAKYRPKQGLDGSKT